MEKEASNVLRQGNDWRKLHFYHKSDTIYQLTFIFCHRFLPISGDRTVDQMVQAARSGKQNIVEGSEDGKSSTEMELKLVNVARGSIRELLEDYKDFLHNSRLPLWKEGDSRYNTMLEYTRSHNEPKDYLPFAEKWSAEEFANTCLTLCYQVDAMINSYLKKLQKDFVTEGGIKERMYAARTGYRKAQDEKMKGLEAENNKLKAENAQLLDAAHEWKSRYDDLKQRAQKAYYSQKKEIERLRKMIKEKDDTQKAIQTGLTE
jgi:four helix bundle suffix protein